MQKYDTEKVVGEGSFGKALLCRRKTDKKRCIIKQIALKKMSRKEAKQTEQESTLLARLQHPNIVSFWEAFHETSKGCFCIVMEYADGGDLSNYIKARKGKYMSESQLLQLFVQIALAMKHVHDRKILHRDLKPGNIFLTSTGMVKLGDFGIARVLRNTGELASTQIGTPYFMSPEQMENKKYSNKSDVWSLGCVLYEMACLKVPFDGGSMKQLIQNILTSNPAPVPSVFSRDLRELAKDMLAKNPRDRPSVNAILSRSVIRERITSFLNETLMHREFSHTILHGQDVLNENQMQANAQRAQVLAEANARLVGGAQGQQNSAAAAAAPPMYPRAAAPAPSPFNIGGGMPVPAPVNGVSPKVGARVPAVNAVPGVIGGLPLVRAASPRDNIRQSPRVPALQGPGPAAAQASPRINLSELERIRAEAKKNGLVLAGLRKQSPRAAVDGRGGLAPVQDLERIRREARDRVEAEKRALEREKAKQREVEKERARLKELEREKEKAREIERIKIKARIDEKERLEREQARIVEREKEKIRERERDDREQREREREKEKERERERERERVAKEKVERDRERDREIQALELARKKKAEAAIPGQRQPSLAAPSPSPSLALSPRAEEHIRKAAAERVLREGADKRAKQEEERVDRERRREEKLQQQRDRENGMLDSSDEDGGGGDSKRITGKAKHTPVVVHAVKQSNSDSNSNGSEGNKHLPPVDPSRREKPVEEKKADGAFLANLAHQMGALQSEVQQLRTPRRQGSAAGDLAAASAVDYNNKVKSPDGVEFALRKYIPNVELSPRDHKHQHHHPSNRGTDDHGDKGGKPVDPLIKRCYSNSTDNVIPILLIKCDSVAGWLENLHNQMGALQAQVEDMKVRSPRSPRPDVHGDLVVAGKQAQAQAQASHVPQSASRVAKQHGGGGGGSEDNKEKDILSRPRVPVAVSSSISPRLAQGQGQGQGHPSAVAADDAKGVNKDPKKVGKGKVGADKGHGKGQGQGKPKAKEPVKNVVRPKPVPKEAVDPAVLRAERKQNREQSRIELKNFLKQQRQQNNPIVKKSSRRSSSELDGRPAWVGVGEDVPIPSEKPPSPSRSPSDDLDAGSIADESRGSVAPDEDDDDDEMWEEDDPVEDGEGENDNIDDGDDNDWGDGDEFEADNGKEKEETNTPKDVDSSVAEEPLTALSQMETRRMGDMITRHGHGHGQPSGSEKTTQESDISTNGISFSSDELLDVANGPNKQQGNDNDDDDNMSFAPDEEEEELTEEAAMEYSKMLQQMQLLLEQGQKEAVMTGSGAGADNEEDDEFNEDDDDKLHMSAITEMDTEDDQSVIASGDGSGSGSGSGSRQRGAAGRYQSNDSPTDLSSSPDLEGQGQGQGGDVGRQPRSSRRGTPDDAAHPKLRSSESAPNKLETVSDPDASSEANGNSMTVCGLPMPLSRVESNVDRDDTYAARIEAIRVFLEEKLGVKRFVKAYRLLKSIQDQEEADDEDALLSKMEAILGTEGLQHLDVMFQLITIEEKFS
eukprot:gene7440-15218_t